MLGICSEVGHPWLSILSSLIRLLTSFDSNFASMLLAHLGVPLSEVFSTHILFVDHQLISAGSHSDKIMRSGWASKPYWDKNAHINRQGILVYPQGRWADMEWRNLTISKIKIVIKKVVLGETILKALRKLKNSQGLIMEKERLSVITALSQSLLLDSVRPA